MKPSFLFYCGECPCSQVKKLKNSPRILFKGRKKEVKEDWILERPTESHGLR
jgi:hypothetical protein